jgi:signal peptidase
LPAANLVFKSRSRDRRWADVVLSVQCAVLVGVLVVTAVAMLLGGCTVLIERSDSMAPALVAGDLLVTRRVRPQALRVGDVITFKEPSRPGVLLTHRLVEITPQGDRYALVTRGDANTGMERFSMPANGSAGRLVLRLPKLGRVLSWLSDRKVRFACLAVAGLLFGLEVLRRIWSSEPAHER